MSKKEVICPKCGLKLAIMDDEDNSVTLEKGTLPPRPTSSGGMILWPFICSCGASHTQATVVTAHMNGGQ